MKSWIDTTAERNNIWLVLVIHGVDGVGWEALTSESLDDYFQYIKNKDNDLWIGTFGDATKYMRERMHSTVRSDNKSGKILISLTHSLDKLMYDLPLTLKTYVSSDWKAVQVKQGNESRILQPEKDEKGKYVIYRAIPNSGSVELDETIKMYHIYISKIYKYEKSAGFINISAAIFF